MDKVISLRNTIWLVVGVLVSVGAILLALFLFTPQNVAIKMPAKGLESGERTVSLRAVNPADFSKVLYSGQIQATVEGDVLKGVFSPPEALQGESYIVEACMSRSGGESEKCFAKLAGNRPRTDVATNRKGDAPLYSCPYYVSGVKSSRFANLTGQNNIELDSRVLCGAGSLGESGSGFEPYSRVDVAKSTQAPGLSLPGGDIVVRDEDKLVGMSFEQLVDKVASRVAAEVSKEYKSHDSDQETVQYFYPTRNVTSVVSGSPSADAQTLYLSGLSLGISGGNVITLPGTTADPIANSTTSGNLSAHDWNMFANKQNSLIFDSGIVNNAGTVSLMSCASGEILKSGTSSWVCAQDEVGGGAAYSAGSGISIDASGTISNTGILGVTASGALTAVTAGQAAAVSLTTSADFSQLSGALALTPTGVSPGTYNTVTVDGAGRVTTATNVTYLTSADAVAGVVNGGGLVMTGSGTAASPYRVGLLSSCSASQILKWDGGQWICSTDNNTDQQQLSFDTSTNSLTLTDGGSVDLSSLVAHQTISLSGDTLTLTNGGSVDLSGYMDNTDNQTLAFDATTRRLTISGSNSGVVIPDANSGGTVTSITAGAGLSGGTITSSGTISLAPTGVGAGTYGNGTSIPVISVDQYGRIASVAATSIPTASAGTAGIISSSDWNTFNGKENILTFSGALVRTGDTVGLMECAASKVLRSNGSAWICADQTVDTNTTYTAGTGITITGANNTISTTALLGVTSSGALTTNTTSQNAAITLHTSGALTQSGGLLDLANTSAAPGTYNTVTVDAKGRVINGTNVTYLTPSEAESLYGRAVAGVVNNGGLVMTGSGTQADPHRVGLITTCGDGQLLKYTAANGWACSNDNDTQPNTDSQVLSYNDTTDELTISNGNTVDLSPLRDNTDNQTLIVNGSGASRTITISGGNTVALSDTDAQQLSYDSTSRTISLTNGGTVALPADQDTTYTAGNGINLSGTVFAINSPTCLGTDKLVWTGTSFSCSADIDTDTTYMAGSGLSLSGSTFALDSPTCAASQYLTWNGTALVCTNDATNYVAGSGISINGSTIANTGVLTVSTGVGIVNTGTAQNPSLRLADTSVAAGTYGTSNQVSTFTVDQQGRLTSAGQVAIGNLDTSAITTGTLALSRGGTGIDGSAAPDGSLLIGNGSGFTLATLTGSNNQIIVTNTSGGIKLSTPQDIAPTSDVTFSTLTTTGAIQVNGQAMLNGNVALGDSTADQVTINGLIAGSDPLRFEGASTDGRVLTVHVIDPTNSSTATIPLLPGNDTFVFENLMQTLSNKTLNNVVLNGKVSGSAVSTNTSLVDPVSGQPSDTIISSQKAVKTYVDNLTLGLNWQQPTDTINIIADVSAPPSSPVVSDAYIINSGGAIGDWSTFSVGDIVVWGADNQWHLLKSAAVGDRLGIAMRSSTAPAGSFAGQANAVATITGGTPGSWTYTFSSPVDNMAFYVDNDNSIFNGETLVYSSDLEQWVTLSASANFVFTNGTERSGNNIQLKLFADGGVELNGTALALKDCPVGQVLKSTGENTYGCAVDNNTTYDAGSGLSLSGAQFAINSPTCSSAQFLTWNGTQFACGAPPAVEDTTNLNIAANSGTATNLQSGDTINFMNGTGTTATVTGKNVSYGLSSIGIAGTYGSATSIPVITTDAYGRVASVTNQAIPVASSTTSGILSATDFNSFLGKEDALTFTGRNLFTRSGNTIAATACSDGQVFRFNATSGNWECSADKDTVYTAGSGITISGTAISNGGVLGVGEEANSPVRVSGTAQNPTIGFQDGTNAGQYWSWSGSSWQLTSAPVDTNTVYTAGQGLDLTGATFKLAQQDAANGQVLKWNGSGWSPAVDENTTYSAAADGGLVLNGTQFALQGCASGQILKASAVSGQWVCSADSDTTYTAGSGIAINAGVISANISADNISDGAITADKLAPTGAAAGTYGDNGVNVVQMTVNAQGQVTAVSNRALPVSSGTTTGVLSETDWNSFNSKQNALTVNGNGIINYNGSDTITGLAGTENGQVMTWNGSAWVAVAPVESPAYVAGNGLSLVGTTFNVNAPTCTAGQYMTWSGSAFACDTPADTTNFNIAANGSNSQSIASGDTVNFQNGTGTEATIGAGGNVSFGLKNTGVTAGSYAASANGSGGMTVPNFTVNVQGQLTSTGTTTVTPTGITNGQLANSSITITASGPLSSSVSTVALGGSTTISLNLATNGAAASSTTASASGLEVSGGALSLIRGCSANQVLKWDATSGRWVCSGDANSGGTVTGVTAGTGLTGGTITSSGTIGLANTGVAAGSYGSSTRVPVITVNAQGQITAATTATIPTANASTTGVLSSADWNTFNGKENVLAFDGPLERSGNQVSLAACSAGQVYQYNGTSWACTTPTPQNTYTAGSGLTLTSGSFAINCGSGGVAHCNGGNSYGTNATIGTNDAHSLHFETNNTVAATLSSTGEMLFKDPSNNVLSFQVQNASSVPQFTVDTVNNRIVIGSNVADNNAIQLVLDSYNSSADPVGVNGAMYYNSALGKFRCYENNAWVNCIGSGESSYPQILVDANRTTGMGLSTAPAVVNFSTASTNIGNAYNTATGVFTAPETGMYQLSMNVTASIATAAGTSSSTNGGFQTQILLGSAVIDTVSDGSANYHSILGAGYYSASTTKTRIFSMTAGQTLSIRAAATTSRDVFIDASTSAKNTLQIVRLK